MCCLYAFQTLYHHQTINPPFFHKNTIPSTGPSSGNVLILNVNNILSGWPMYVIDFTVENPEPMKLLLCLKDTSKYVQNKEKEDQDSIKTPGFLLFSCNLTHLHPLDASIQKKRDNVMVSVDISLAIEQDEAYRTIPKEVDTIPVNLDGICKGPKIAKHKIFNDNSEDIPWPPIWPCAFHAITAKVPTSSLHLIKTTPALVKAI
ncbi:hypothetical protein BS17DRAFT_770656 [Gyrodon lividus]|nr:hypothetical protein BS17DRAFT_770656 [Gyrodon lividus]